MWVSEIFGSIDGEGKRTGQLTTFIRLTGCNLRCVYCDTQYAFAGGTVMTVAEILEKCKQIGYHNITLTGGEPLIHHEVERLIRALCYAGYQVNVETNGSVSLRDYIKMRERENFDLFFTVDYKTLLSGENYQMDYEAFCDLNNDKDIVKCVVGSREDMDNALQYLDCIGKFNIWFSPIYGKIEPAEIVDYIKEHNRQDVTVQVQLHKIIWDPQKRGV